MDDNIVKELKAKVVNLEYDVQEKEEKLAEVSAEIKKLKCGKRVIMLQKMYMSISRLCMTIVCVLLFHLCNVLS